jgi:predicted DNA-binding transcriptional regulator AlpA
MTSKTKDTIKRRVRPPPRRDAMQRVSEIDDPAQYSTTEPVRFLSKAEVAELVGVSAVTIWKWTVSGVFPVGREVGGRTCWRQDVVTRWLNSRPLARVKNAS